MDTRAKTCWPGISINVSYATFFCDTDDIVRGERGMGAVDDGTFQSEDDSRALFPVYSQLDPCGWERVLTEIRRQLEENHPISTSVDWGDVSTH